MSLWPGSTAQRDDGRFDLHGGTPFWLVRNGLGTQYPRSDHDLRTEVVIVGGGITGALCAFYLTKAGVPCVVVDARTIGMGSTCASTALLQYEIDTPLSDLQDLVGMDHAIRSYRACVDAVHALQQIAATIGEDSFQKRPSIQFASRRSHVRRLEREARLRQEHGFALEFATGNDVEQWLPFAAPAAIRSVIGAEVDAWRFTHALHRWNTAHGADLFELTTIEEFDCSPHRVVLKTESGHSIRAQHVVMATGYESVQHLAKPVVELHSTYAIITERSGVRVPWKDSALIWETADPYRYLRTAEDGRIVIGGLDDPFRAPALRDAMLVRKAVRLERELNKLLPDRKLHREFAWCGTFGSTKDGLPYIDHHPDQQRMWFALGMGGNGITFSVTAAEIIRDAILGMPNEKAALFRFDR